MKAADNPEGRALTVRAISNLPNLSGESYAHMGKYAGAAVLAAFEMIGGVERLAAWSDSNPTDFFCKVLPKVIQRSQQVDISATLTIDDAIDRLERQNALPAPIEAEFREVVEEGIFYDL